jgi:predicted nucleic acid-binding protein
MRIYLDTSVISALHGKDARLKDIARAFFASLQFRNFTIYGSEIVATEIRNTPDLKLRKLLVAEIEKYSLEILPITEEIEALALRYVGHKIIPVRYRADALHIACCVIYNIPVLVSLNFAHIVRHQTRIEVNSLNQKLQLPQIDLCSPEEV